MNTALLYSSLLVAALAFAPCSARAAGKPAAAPAPEAPPPKSVFVIDPQFGKDPFFPKTTRFQGVTVKIPEVVTSSSSQFPEDIRVQGFSNQRDKIIVILNGKSIAKGEKIELNLRGHRYPVRCVDVTDKTILLEVNGITKEMPLPVVAPAPATPQ
jgi:hypothetical protein